MTGIRKEVIEVTEATDSITLKRSVKGVYSWETKMYFEVGNEGMALARMKLVDEMLRATYLPKPEPEEGEKDE